MLLRVDSATRSCYYKIMSLKEKTKSLKHSYLILKTTVMREQPDHNPTGFGRSTSEKV